MILLAQRTPPAAAAGSGESRIGQWRSSKNRGEGGLDDLLKRLSVERVVDVTAARADHEGGANHESRTRVLAAK